MSNQEMAPYTPGHIYRAEGHLYVAVFTDALSLIRVREEDGETPPAFTLGERVGFVMTPLGELIEIINGPTPPDHKPPANPMFFEHLAENSAEYVQLRAEGHFKLRHGHVYRYGEEVLYAYMPAGSPATWVLYLLDPDTYGPVAKRAVALYAYRKAVGEEWQKWYWRAPIPLPTPLTFDDLEHVGEGEQLADQLLNDKFNDLMNWMT